MAPYGTRHEVHQFRGCQHARLDRIRPYIGDHRVYLGGNELRWQFLNGMDANGIVEVAKKEKLIIVLDGYSMPENAILLLGSENTSLQNESTYARFPVHSPHGQRISFHALQ